jgi:hypothetical protein
MVPARAYYASGAVRRRLRGFRRSLHQEINMNQVLRFAPLFAAVLVPGLAGALTASAQTTLEDKARQLPMERSTTTGTPLAPGAQPSAPGTSGSSQSGSGALIDNQSKQGPMERSLEGASPSGSTVPGAGSVQQQSGSGALIDNQSKQGPMERSLEGGDKPK